MYIYIDQMCPLKEVPLYTCTVGVKKKCPYFSVVQGSTYFSNTYCGWFIRLLH